MKCKKWVCFLMLSLVSITSFNTYAITLENLNQMNGHFIFPQNVLEENEPYMVIEYNEGTLENTLKQLGFIKGHENFPKKVKIEGIKILDEEDLKYLRDSFLGIDLTDTKLENDILPEEIFAYSQLVEIKLPKTLKEIHQSAFAYSSSLQKVVLPETLIAIKEGAFIYCSSLVDIHFPVSLKEIGNSAFEGVPLDKIQ